MAGDTGGGRGHPNARSGTEGALVGLGDGSLEGIDVVGMDEIDGAATEAAAGHAAAKAAGSLVCGIDEGIQFGATNGVIIAKAGMGLGHPRPELLKAPRGKGIGEAKNSMVFRHHMAAATEDGFRQAGAVPLEVLQGDITEGADMRQV